MAKFKKLFAVLLAATMVMGFSVTAFAEETTTIPVTFSIDTAIASEHQSAAIDRGYNSTVVSAVQSGTYGSLTRNYTFSGTSNGLAAIQYAGNQIISGTVVTGSTSGGAITIDKVFTLPTIDIYGTNSWTGYYWMIIINGEDANGSTVRFESPEYPSGIVLGDEHTFNNIWNNNTHTYSSITCTVTSLELHYVTASYTW